MIIHHSHLFIQLMVNSPDFTHDVTSNFFNLCFNLFNTLFNYWPFSDHFSELIQVIFCSARKFIMLNYYFLLVTLHLLIRLIEFFFVFGEITSENINIFKCGFILLEEVHET